MLSSLDIGVSALEQFQESMDVIGNNIANENTVGYKDATTDFEDTLSQTLQSGGFSGASNQVGTGVTTSGISTNFAQGTIDQTGVTSDLAISGNGFFVVRDPSTGADYLTRAGDFQVDPNGYLVTESGMRVQGYTNSGLSTLGDIQVTNAGAPNGDTSAVASYSFASNGTLTIELADGTSYTGGQVLLQNVTSPETLLKQGQNLYGNITAANPLAAPVAPGTSGTGTVVGGALEGSNVDLASEFANLITAQRGFEAGSKIVTTSDEVLQDLVNLNAKRPMVANRMEPTPGGTEEAAVATPAPTPTAGGGIKGWLPLIAAVVLMPVLAFAMTQFVLVPRMQKAIGVSGASSAPAAAPAESASTPSKAAAGGKKESVAMNKLLVNVAGTMGARYLLVSLSVVGADADLKQKMQDNDAQLRDMACGALRTKTLADLEKPDACNIIRSELISGFNNILGGAVVQEIYLTEFAIQ